jgi:excisionase family DNA binding protein
MLTTGQAAQHLGCSRRYITRLAREGQLPAVNVSAGQQRPAYRIPTEAVTTYVAQRSTGAQS